MDLEKIFSDLESSQTHDSEEAKKKLAEIFTQSKEQWLVQNMMEYYLKTNSLRIAEVLVKVQSPHDAHIFDRLTEWLKLPKCRQSAINLFSFVVRKHPTWLYKVEKHRLIKDVFKLMLTEKEIVPLMSALLCIITLLPIIPNSVPIFFNDLFEVFGHLASCNSQNRHRLTDDKLVHLQLGLQMLFHSLYGMYPNNFVAYLSDFIKKDQKGAIYQHTIKPLLETVRVHPLLLTATVNTEVSSTRWKDMEPHDVVVECTRVTLPVLHQDLSQDLGANNYALPASPAISLTQFSHNNRFQNATDIGFYEHKPLRNWDEKNYGSEIIWSPQTEFASNTVPLTPTPSYMLPMATPNIGGVNQLMSLTGSSPPEAAVEATPETTPMKDVVNELKPKQGSSLLVSGSAGIINNPHAVRSIFPSSQPSSPLRKESNLFSFTDAVMADTAVIALPISTTPTIVPTATTTFVSQEITTHCSTTDRYVRRILEDRTNSRNSFQTIEAQANAATKHGYLTPNKPSSKSETPEIDADILASRLEDFSSARTRTHTPTSIEHITKTCVECNETDRTVCKAGGLQMSTGRSMQIMLKGIKRNRMVSDCCNDSSCDNSSDAKMNADSNSLGTTTKVRRTKSCSSISLAALSPTDDEDKNVELLVATRQQERRLQKSGKMLAIASARKTVTGTTSKNIVCSHVACQTIDTEPQHYENALITMICEHKNLYRQYECNLLNPHKILDQFISSSLAPKLGYDTYRCDQEHFQLICLQLQYERYRREIHAERNRRLMGRSRNKRSLEMERDRCQKQLSYFVSDNQNLMKQIDATIKAANEREQQHFEELIMFKSKYQKELDQNKCLRQANDDLQTRLNEELASRKEINYELEALRGQIFNLTAELQQAQHQMDVGHQCKQELARLEAEFIVMGEIQVKCRDRLAEMDNLKSREDELRMIQESYDIELKSLKHKLEERTSQFDGAKHKILELQAQLVNCEKVITDQKRLLKTVKDEYEERFKSVSKKYDVQKNILMQMEEKITMLHRPQPISSQNACSPDTDRTDVASSVDRNSPLSTSLASSESLSTSLRSTELRNLQQLAEANSSSTINIAEGGPRMPTTVDADAPSTSQGQVATAAIATVSSHPHLHLQQPQQKR